MSKLSDCVACECKHCGERHVFVKAAQYWCSQTGAELRGAAVDSITIEHWRNSQDLRFLIPMAGMVYSRRKLRLFATAATRILPSAGANRIAAEVRRISEGVADNALPESSLDEIIRSTATSVYDNSEDYLVSYKEALYYLGERNPVHSASQVASRVLAALRFDAGAQNDLLAIFDDHLLNPFENHPQITPDSLLTNASRLFYSGEISQEVFLNRLEDAGAAPWVVKHFQNRLHFKGCWVLDALCGRETHG